jgi:hypothetical protein
MQQLNNSIIVLVEGFQSITLKQLLTNMKPKSQNSVIREGLPRPLPPGTWAMTKSTSFRSNEYVTCFVTVTFSIMAWFYLYHCIITLSMLKTVNGQKTFSLPGTTAFEENFSAETKDFHSAFVAFVHSNSR